MAHTIFSFVPLTSILLCVLFGFGAPTEVNGCTWTPLLVAHVKRNGMDILHTQVTRAANKGAIVQGRAAVQGRAGQGRAA